MGRDGARLHGLSLLIRRLGEEAPAYLSIAAERIVDRLEAVGATELGIVQMEIEARRDRWLPSLRVAIDEGRDAAIVASRLLDVVGESEDVLRLRRFSRRSQPRVDPMLGRQLARRLALRVQIEDQGRVAIRIGDRSIEGTSIRRKVLTLLCYLITRSRFAATQMRCWRPSGGLRAFCCIEFPEPDRVLPQAGLRTGVSGRHVAWLCSARVRCDLAR